MGRGDTVLQALWKTDCAHHHCIHAEVNRGPVVPAEPGKTKLSIRLDNTVIEHFRAQVERAGSGNYQTSINDALVAFIQQSSVIDAVRQVVREEMSVPQCEPGRAWTRRAGT